MKIQIGGTTIKLNNREVASCKKIVSKFINAVQKETDEKKTPTYFFTMLIVMHLMSQSILSEFDSDVIAQIIEKLHTNE
jgi:signal transduction histidine kinase